MMSIGPKALAPLLSLILATAVLSGIRAQGVAKQRPAARVPHLFVIVMENEGSSAIVGSRDAPYINSLAHRYGFAANYFGVTHPSLPNYVAMIAGDTYGANNDDPSQRFGSRNLVDQLEAHHKSWKAYMESMPRSGYDGDYYPTSGPPLYARKHDPFMLMNDVLGNPRRRLKVVPGSVLSRDLKRNRVPAFSFIVPNLCHDMHGDSSPSSSCSADRVNLVRLGDDYLSRLVPSIIRSRAWSGDSTILLIWDESGEGSTAGCCDTPPGLGGGKVPAIVIARQGVRNFTSRASYNHFSLLKTVETIWKLGYLGKARDNANVHSMTRFLSH